MRSALAYLLLTRIKNQIKSIFKSPAKIIYMVFLIVIIALTVFSGKKGSFDARALRDIKELTAGIFALYTLMFILIAKNGFNNGASMFTMQDVNLIFTSPIKPQKVLFFGLFQQLGTSLLYGLFLLFQYSWMHNLYGIDFSIIIVILIGYAFAVFCAQLTAMAIYSFTSSNESRKRILKIIFYGIILLFGSWLVLNIAGDTTQVLPKLVATINSQAFKLFPISGWAMNIVSGIILSDFSGFAIGSVLCAVYVAGIVILINTLNQDYYEDVLKTTEMSYSAITAKKSGQIGESVPQKVKIGKTGLNGGMGADAFYYKHLVENRRAKVFILNTTSLIFAACVIVFSFFMRGIGISAVFIFGVYMQLFSVALGRFSKELIKPYIYLVPESPFKKLLASLKESFSGFVLEAVIVFVPVAFILQLPIIDMVFCIIARISFAMIFTAGNILIGRVFGTVTSKILVFVFYFISIIIICSPGIVAGVLLTSFHMIIISENVTMFLALAACNIPISLLVIYLCRNMLQYAELNNN